MKKKIEVCVKCGREYDGHYPCPCGNLKFKELKKEVEVKPIILDDNALSILSYAEEFPENWKKICESSKKEVEE